LYQGVPGFAGTRLGVPDEQDHGALFKVQAASLAVHSRLQIA
jgi:hypothetical protein